MNSKQIIIMAILSAFVAVPTAQLMGAQEPQDRIVFNDATHPLLARSFTPQRPIISNREPFATTTELFDHNRDSNSDPYLVEYETQIERFLQDKASKAALLATGNAQLEYNEADPVMGIGADGQGQNKYGKVLMQLRSEIRSGRIEYIEGIGSGIIMNNPDAEYDEPAHHHPRHLLQSTKSAILKAFKSLFHKG